MNLNPFKPLTRVTATTAAADVCLCHHAAIQVEGLNLRYGDKKALESISLDIEPCRITALIGPSGCGKTSFLSCINRLTDLIPTCAVSGRVTVGSTSVFAPDTDVVALRRRVGMIFQKPNPLPFSIFRNLSFPLHEHGIRDKDEVASRVEAALSAVGLLDEVKDKLHGSALALSGGQQQRLCLARALVLEPDVLLLDEPCSALDPLSSGVVEDFIAEQRGRYTMLMVTHNLAQARRIADHVGLFWTRNGAGELIEFGTREEIFEDARHELTRAYVRGERG